MMRFSHLCWRKPSQIDWEGPSQFPEYDETIEWKDQIEDLFYAVNRAERKTIVAEIIAISAHYELKFLAIAFRDETWLLGSLPGRDR